MLLLTDLQLHIVGSLHDGFQILLLVLQLHPQDLLTLPVMLLKVADLLIALGTEVNSDGLVEVRVSHLP